jgi:hypothetical protein
VSPPKIGSRVGEICFGGILDFYADLRRKTFWGNLKWEFLGVLLVSPRGTSEEGGPRSAFWGNVLGWWGLCEISLRTTARDEGFTLRTTARDEGFTLRTTAEGRRVYSKNNR